MQNKPLFFFYIYIFLYYFFALKKQKRKMEGYKLWALQLCEQSLCSTQTAELQMRSLFLALQGRWVGEVSQRPDRCESVVQRGKRMERQNKQTWNMHRGLKHCKLSYSVLFFLSHTNTFRLDGPRLITLLANTLFFKRKTEQLQVLTHQGREEKQNKTNKSNISGFQQS